MAMLQFLSALLLMTVSIAEPAAGASEEIVLVNASQPSTDLVERQLQDEGARGRRLAMTSELRDALLNKHNTLRSTAPDSPCTAADMLKMSWDSDLETAAQEWADGCLFQHDPDNQMNHWGENLAITTARDASASRMERFVQSWYDEVEHTEWFDGNTRVRAKSYSNARQHCPFAYNSKTDACMIGHFTQVMAAASHKLGCGVSVCSQGTLLVCKYSPAGNLATTGGQAAPFQFGASCGSCESDCEQKLCQTPPVSTCIDKLGTSISRFTVGGTPYTDCQSVIAAYGCDFVKRSQGLCSRSCSECTPATKLGTDFCGTEAGRRAPYWPDKNPQGLISGSCKAATSWSILVLGLLVMLW